MGSWLSSPANSRFTDLICLCRPLQLIQEFFSFISLFASSFAEFFRPWVCVKESFWRSIRQHVCFYRTGHCQKEQTSVQELSCIAESGGQFLQDSSYYKNRVNLQLVVAQSEYLLGVILPL